MEVSGCSKSSWWAGEGTHKYEEEKRKLSGQTRFLYLCGGASCGSGLALAYANSGGAWGRSE